MKNLIFILVSFISTNLLAQTSITLNNQTIEGREHSTGWIFENETDSIIALEKSTYQKLIRKLQEMEAELKHKEAVIQAQNTELEAYDNYELNAEKLIVSQDSLLLVADSLYQGYKGLYTDLKSIADMKKFGLIIGTGVQKYESENPGYLFDAGFEYNKLQLSYQFGNNYNALVFWYRIPLF